MTRLAPPVRGTCPAAGSIPGQWQVCGAGRAPNGRQDGRIGRADAGTVDSEARHSPYNWPSAGSVSGHSNWPSAGKFLALAQSPDTVGDLGSQSAVGAWKSCCRRLRGRRRRSGWCWLSRTMFVPTAVRTCGHASSRGPGIGSGVVRGRARFLRRWPRRRRVGRSTVSIRVSVVGLVPASGFPVAAGVAGAGAGPCRPRYRCSPAGPCSCGSPPAGTAPTVAACNPPPSASTAGSQSLVDTCATGCRQRRHGVQSLHPNRP